MDKHARLRSFVFPIIIFIFLFAILAFGWTNPTVTLESPASGTFSDGSKVEFNVSWTGAAIGADVYANLTLFLNGAANISEGNSTGAFVNDTEYNLTVRTIEDGVFIWNIRVFNGTAGPSLWASDNYTLTVDSAAPVIGGISPSDISIYTQNNSLTVTAQCNDTNPNQMELWVNGVINKSTAYTSNTSYTFAAVNKFSNGENVTWAVRCTDDGSNVVWSNDTTTGNFRSQHMDLTAITLTSNNTDAWWFTSNSTVDFNITFTGSSYPQACVLYGDFNRTTSPPFKGTWAANQTILNSTGFLESKETAFNFSLNNIHDSNDTGKYIWNIWCNSSSGRTAWLSSTNLTMGVDTIAPSTPDLIYISTQYYTNTTSTVRRWRNMSQYMTTTDQTPTIVFYEIQDVNDVTVTIAVDNNEDMASPTKMYTISGVNESGTMTIVNNTEIAVTGGRPYNDWYITLNVTDEAGNVKWSYWNETSTNVSYLYRVSAHGANLTEDLWNPIGFARTSQNISLEYIMNETSASYIAVYNTSHDFITCSATNNQSLSCATNVTRGIPLWIYVDENKSWDYSWWDSTGHWTPDITADSSLGYGMGGGVINITNMSSSNWNYMSIMNWSDGCTFENIQVLMNNTFNITSIAHGIQGNLNETGLGNITFMSYFNYTEPEYYPYYWAFGSPWNETKLEFRDVAAFWMNNTASPQLYFNRSGC